MNTMDKNGEPMSAIATQQVQFTGRNVQSVRRTFPHYDGYALLLSVFSIQAGEQLEKTTELPDYFENKWSSLVNLKRYQTRANITKQPPIE